MINDDKSRDCADCGRSISLQTLESLGCPWCQDGEGNE
jgi:DNA-directed RNA polymerase subunit RPC12/RpoP